MSWEWQYHPSEAAAVLAQVWMGEVDMHNCNAEGQRQTLLMMASRQYLVDDVQRLIEAGADIHACDWLGQTALHHAAYHEHMPVLQLLVEAGADINCATHAGRTALGFACRNANAAKAQYLLERGADVQPKCSLPLRPLAMAISGRSARLAALVIKAGADVSQGVLKIALKDELRDLDVLQCLVAAGADISVSDEPLETNA